MQPIDLKTFLACIGMTGNNFSQMSFNDHVALAFGSPVGGRDGVYLPLDAVAMRLMGELSLVIGRTDATNIILSHFDIWADAVGRSEFDERYMYLLVAVADAGLGRDGEYVVTSGTHEEIHKDFEGVPITRAVSASVTGIIADIRTRARAVGVALDKPFFLPPDHPEYREMLNDAKHRRMMALQRHRGGKKYKEHKRRPKVGRSIRSNRGVVQ